MFLKPSKDLKANPDSQCVLPPDGNSPGPGRKTRKPHPIRNGVLASVLCFIAYIVIGTWIWDLIEPFTGDFARPVSELIFELPVGLLVYWYFRKKRPAESIRKFPKRSALLIAAAYALIVCFPSQMFYYNFHEVIQPGVTSSVNNEVPVVLVLELLVIAPILEEILFRGAFFGVARRFMGFWPSAITNAAIFALMHFSNPLTMALTVYLTLASAVLYEKTGYLRYGMILHALSNWSGPILAMTGIMLPPPVSATLFALSGILFIIELIKKDVLMDKLMG